MQDQSLHGGFADAPVQSARAFRAILQAMARPGRIEAVDGALPPAPLSVAAGVLLLTLADPATPVFLAGAADCAAVRDWIAFHTGAPRGHSETAAFALGPWPALRNRDYALGSAEYPDRSTTLIIETERLDNSGATLSGPGIRDAARLSLPEVAAFQRNARLFPRGLDHFLTCGRHLAALPRSTQVS